MVENTYINPEQQIRMAIAALRKQRDFIECRLEHLGKALQANEIPSGITLGAHVSIHDLAEPIKAKAEQPHKWKAKPCRQQSEFMYGLHQVRRIKKLKIGEPPRTSLQGFMEDVLERASSENRIHAVSLYRIYCKWCEMIASCEPLDSLEFAKEAKKLGYTLDGEMWQGVQIRPKSRPNTWQPAHRRTVSRQEHREATPVVRYGQRKLAKEQQHREAVSAS